MQKRGISIDSLALIFSFIIFAQLLSYVVPQGTFERVPYPDNPNRSMVVAGTYEAVSAEEEVSLPAWHFLEGVTKGLADAQDIIFLIFIVGGVIEILRKTGAIDAALHRSVHHLGHSPWILILGCFAMFSAGSFTSGMGEEYVPLIPIIVTMTLTRAIPVQIASFGRFHPRMISAAACGSRSVKSASSGNVGVRVMGPRSVQPRSNPITRTR